VVLGLNRWYTLKIACVGDSIEVYVDDVLRLSYIDEEAPLLWGRIGLEIAHNSHVCLDAVKVYKTHRLYVAHLIRVAQDEVDEARMLDADTGEAELQRLKGEALDEFKDGMINEETYNILNKRIDDYMREIREEIEKENA